MNTLLKLLPCAALISLAPLASAQDQGRTSAEAQPGSVVVPTERGEVIVTPGETTVQSQTLPPYGFPQPGEDINAGLPSSSRPVTDTSRSQDGFDLNRSGESAGTLRGNEGSEVILTTRPVRTPDIHTVRRGDTLWDLSAYYYDDPYQWPRVWSYNPQVTNPHWIYPGDQIRMRRGGGPGGAGYGSRLIGGSTGRGDGTGPGGVPQNTVFLRQQGYIDDPEKDVWGTLIGAREDQKLLSDGNHVYLQIKPRRDLSVGQELTIFVRVRKPQKVPGARRPPGEIIAIKGTVRVTQWDAKNHLARGEIIESTDVIERGALVGPVGRRFDVVPPRPAKVNLWARVLTSFYPHVYFGQNQVLFIDRGTEDGISAGNRLYIVRRGDTWRRTLETAKQMARDRMRIDAPENVVVEETPLLGDERRFPDEIIGEIRVLRANRYSSICMVTVSHREIVVGDRAVARKGQ